MQKRPGTFIAIEGTDGSGKGTQFALLCDRLRQAGYDVATFDFPQYDAPSSYFVKQYLNGAYGGLEQVGPYTASLFYALDRYEAAPGIREALAQGKVVVSNRFTGSSMGHQGTKFKSAEERRGYFIWLDNLEFEMLQIPRPDISFILRVPAEIAQQLIDQKAQRAYTDKKLDLHEQDASHLQKAVEVYDDLAQLFPKDFQRIDCVRGGKLLAVEAVQNMLWEKIAPLLPPPPQLEMKNKDIPSPAAAAVASSPTHSISEPAAQPEETVQKEGAAHGASREGASAETPAPNKAAVATTAAKEESMPAQAPPVSHFREVIAQHFVLENASQILAQCVEGSRFAAYVGEPEQHDYTHPDANGRYRYHTPAGLSESTAQRYEAYMDKLFELHAAVTDAVEHYLAGAATTPPEKRTEAWLRSIRAAALQAARPLLPAAATSKVVVLAFGHALEDLVTELVSKDLGELRSAGDTLLREARQLSPVFLPDADNPDHPSNPVTYRAKTTAAAAKITSEFLPEQHAAESTVVARLAEALPRNELDILADALYPHANLPLADLQRQIAGRSYSQKLDIWEAYMGERASSRQLPGSAFESIRYTWDMLTDYDSFRELQRQQLIGGAAAQAPTPRYGYDMPEIIEAAGAADDFERAFDLSLELYSLLQSAGNEKEAQYATLLGHRMRWKLRHTAYDAIRLLERQSSPSTEHVKRQMHAALSDAHPMVGESIHRPV